MTIEIDVADAIVAAVRAAEPTWDVYDALVPEVPPLQYGVVFAGIGRLDRVSLKWQPNDGTWRWYVTSVGQDRHAAAWHASSVRDHLLAVRITADHWRCSKVTHEHSEDPTRDESSTPRPVVIAVNEYSLLATRI